MNIEDDVERQVAAKQDEAPIKITERELIKLMHEGVTPRYLSTVVYTDGVYLPRKISNQWAIDLLIKWRYE